MRRSVVLGSPVDREIDAREDLERPVGFRERLRHERGLAAGRGLREADVRDAVFLAHLFEPGQELLGSGDHLVRRRGLRRLRAELGRLLSQRRGLLLGVDSFLLAALLVGDALALVVLPAHVVDVDDLAVRVEVEHAVDGLADELDVVADHDEPALVRLEEVAQPHDAVGVEVVGRLVEDHGVGVAEEDASEFDAATLSAGERLERLIEDPVGQGEVVRNDGGLRLGRVSADGFEPLGEPAEAAHRLLGDVRVVAAHVLGGLADAGLEVAEPARVEDARARELFGVARPRILGQVAELAGHLHGSIGRNEVAREHLGQRRLAGAVAPHEAHLVSGGDAEVHATHQLARTDADLEVTDGKHGGVTCSSREDSAPERASLPV
jgi:hypothetical protein